MEPFMETLTPLSDQGLWEAVIITPGRGGSVMEG